MRKSKYIKKYYKRKYKKKYAGKKASYKSKSRYRRKAAWNRRSWKTKAKAVELKKGYENSATASTSFTVGPPTEPTSVCQQKQLAGTTPAPYRTISGRWVAYNSPVVNGATVPYQYDVTGILGGFTPQTWIVQGIYPGQGSQSFQRIGTKVDVHRMSWKWCIRKVFQCSNYPSSLPVGPFAQEWIDQYCNYGIVILFAPTWGNAGQNSAIFNSNLNNLSNDTAYWEAYRNGTVPFNYLTDTYKVKEVKRKVFKMNQQSWNNAGTVNLGGLQMQTFGLNQKYSGIPSDEHRFTISMRFSKGMTLKYNQDGASPPDNLNYACMLVWYGCSGIKVQFERYISYVDS